jgi:sec-independent protein translocase protein TatA
MMPQLGAPELIIILVIIVLIFGVGKLPEVGQALGKGIREFRGAAEGQDDEPESTPAPTAVEAPRPTTAVEAPRQPVTPVVTEAQRPVATAAVTPVATPTTPTTPPVAAATTTYIIVEGDTLDAVATKHQVTVEELMAANGYSQRDRVLYAGDKLQVPSKTA